MKRAAAATAISAAIAMSGSAFAQDDQLRVWIGGDKGYSGLQKVGDWFTEETGIRVIVEYPEDATSRFEQAAAAGGGPDIWIWAHDRAGDWAQAGLLRPVNPSASVREGINDTGWEAFTIGGRTWGYPIAFEAIGLIYNRDLVPEAPATFEEIFEIDQALQEDGKNAILWDYNNTYFTWPLLAAAGGYAFAQDENGDYIANDTGVNNDGALAGANMLVRLIEEGVMPRGATYSDMERRVNNGEVAMMINGPWAWDNLRRSGIDFGVAPIPSINGEPGSPFVGVLGAMINRNSANSDLAVEFIENYILDVRGLKMIDDDVPLGVPANQAFYEEIAADPRIRATMANVEAGHPMPSNAEMGRFWSAMESALQNMTSGRQSVEEALNDAAARIKSR
ncbi:maltose ABC transporter substrate-binding protein MalE [Alkalilimnicola ehrlichii]|uniref:Maltodextrin-binding protein n=1 Tax=Alkalilimnicola ehrlichii TaxID=351052 RepID=A0A3E0WIY2_9GAMM|nr:maltose/maltodextrin ABC transporter substrate-binding protein MalE [Alkalilimnicola ehrlichii]RFA25296.1 maltose ABC transporter substrate-binding protein MalE [Alkalilimnicola ehrlichii]RFA32409.1 maltose ABC transporter substrate-binding protein MalE [Alkalilimnicola ehrlichii]